MFDKLIRRVFDASNRGRVGFLSEPTALVATAKRDRKLRVVSLHDWYAIDKANGNDDAVAAVDRYADGKDYAIVVSAREPGLIAVALEGARAEFIDRFVAEGSRRGLMGGSIREARINVPPPPPPPTYPPLSVVARLDAALRVASLPVVDVAAIEAQVDVAIDR